MQHFIGCDVHTRNQVVAWIEAETGEIRKRRLEHGGEEVRKFYAQFPRGTVVGIGATFPAYWFERLLGELGRELWVGDAARIRASEVRYQKTDLRATPHFCVSDFSLRAQFSSCGAILQAISKCWRASGRSSRCSSATANWK